MLRPPLPRDCIAWFEYYLITITLTINALKVAGSLRSYNTMGKLVYEVVLHVKCTPHLRRAYSQTRTTYRFGLFTAPLSQLHNSNRGNNFGSTQTDETGSLQKSRIKIKNSSYIIMVKWLNLSYDLCEEESPEAFGVTVAVIFLSASIIKIPRNTG